MSWEHDPLWAKAQLYFERAFNESRDTPEFGIWCSLGLELLARSTIASVSPALLALPDNDQKHLLHALGLSTERVPKSLGTARVLALCEKLFPEFTKDDLTASAALINRRNEELHSGAATFDAYRPSEWLTGFYRACRALCAAMGHSLVDLFGQDEADVADGILAEDRTGTRQRVQRAIASHRQVFEDKSPKDREAARERAAELGEQLAHERHHRVNCPVCGCVASVEGKTFGRELVSHDDGEIIGRQAVAPTSFSCSACELKLTSYAELEEAALGGHYTRTTTYSPEEYYGLVDPGNIDIQEYLADMYDEYDNE